MSNQLRYNLGMAALGIGVLIALFYIVSRMTGYADPSTAIAISAIVLILIGRVLIRRFSVGRDR
jgi:hypothetical protein